MSKTMARYAPCFLLDFQARSLDNDIQLNCTVRLVKAKCDFDIVGDFSPIFWGNSGSQRLSTILCACLHRVPLCVCVSFSLGFKCFEHEVDKSVGSGEWWDLRQWQEMEATATGREALPSFLQSCLQRLLIFNFIFLELFSIALLILLSSRALDLAIQAHSRIPNPRSQNTKACLMYQ